MNDSYSFAPPWEPVRQFAGNLVDELYRELHPGHVLWGCCANAIARRTDCDDVLFSIHGEPVRFAQVHQTWSGGEECEGFPDTVVFDSFEEWARSEEERLLREAR